MQLKAWAGWPERGLLSTWGGPCLQQRLPGASANAAFCLCAFKEFATFSTAVILDPTPAAHHLPVSQGCCSPKSLMKSNSCTVHGGLGASSKTLSIRQCEGEWEKQGESVSVEQLI